MDKFYQKFLLCICICSIFLSLHLWIISTSIDSSSKPLIFISWFNNIIYNNSSFISFNSTTSGQNPKFNTSTKLILHIETREFHYLKDKSKKIYRPVPHCPKTACTVTNDLSQFKTADAIMFNGRFMTKEQMLEKPKGQVWIYHQNEAPARMNPGEIILAKSLPPNLFNWTVSYRTDSDVYMPYGGMDFGARNNKASAKINNKTLSNLRKKKMIAWVVSNCGSTTNNRGLLAKALSKYITVDIYGACGTKNCSIPRSKETGKDCRLNLSKKYKFYLSFENSLCQDYITEKFFDTIRLTDMVPIVYGLNYSSVYGLPSDSYINVEDFSSVQELANYLIWLDKNPTEYLKYLQAKRAPTSNGSKKLRKPEPECDLCKKLWNGYTNMYADIYYWWTHSKLSSNYTRSGRDENEAAPPLACQSGHDWPIMSNISTT